MSQAVSSVNVVGGAKARPWYAEPYVWLVIGGPLAVVVASVITITLAVRNADPVLERKSAATINAEALQRLSEEERAAVLSTSLEPAQKVRNHVASPVIPGDK
jgi:uncharacterized protein